MHYRTGPEPAVTKEIRERHERACYGVTIEEFRNGTLLTDWEDPNDLIMLSMSIQSDCQELINFQETEEEIRKYLNRSKYVLGQLARILNTLKYDQDDPRIQASKRG